MFTLTISVGQTSGRCIAQIAKMSVDPKFIKLTAHVFRRCFQNSFNRRTDHDLDPLYRIRSLWMRLCRSSGDAEGKRKVQRSLLQHLIPTNGSKQEWWRRLGFLLGEERTLHQVQYNGFRISSLVQIFRLLFLVRVFLAGGVYCVPPE